MGAKEVGGGGGEERPAQGICRGGGFRGLKRHSKGLQLGTMANPDNYSSDEYST
jgi:hypothetical protein